MARFRFAFYLSLAALLMAVPHMTFAASFFGPIIPQSGSCFCDGGPLDWGCVLQVIQNLIKLAVSLGVFFCVMWLAWGGFSLIASRGNPEAISTAKARAFNSIVGIAVILCSWLIVDFVMKALYNPQATFNGSIVGPWNAILTGTGNDQCIKATTPISITSGSLNSQVSTGGTIAGTSADLSTAGTGACNAATVQAGAAAGGYTLSNLQANQLACIANHESACGSANGIGNPNFSWNKAGKNGKASTAAGPYQVLLRTNAACYQNAACTQAAGGQSLDCKQAFNSNGFIVNAALAQKCLVMAGNTACSASAAACQLQHQSFTSMYATDPDVGRCSAGS